MGFVRVDVARRLAFALLAVWTLSARAQPAETAAPAPAPQAQPAASGIVSGTVLDKSTGDAVIEAGVEVVGTGRTVRTDLDGHFKLELPEGTYQLRIFAPFYTPVRLEGVVVKAGQVVKASTSLASAPGNVQVVEVVARADRAAEATQLTERKNAAVVSETVSAEVIKKSPAKDAAEVVKRLPAVAVKDNKFIYVRGLGERYSSALLNGSRLPSPDPDKRVVPLDLFPADFIQSLSLIKTYTPDLPGDFSGGLVDIHTREFPDQLSVSANTSVGFNTQTTFQGFTTYDGSNRDFLGFGSAFRALPGEVPGTTTFNTLPASTRDTIGRDFKNIWNTETQRAQPNTTLNLSAGDSFGPLGVNLAGIYTTEYLSVPGRIENQYVNAGNLNNVQIKQDTHFIYDDSFFRTRVGGLFTASYKLTDTDKLFFRSLVDHNSVDDVTQGQGKDTQLLPQQQTSLRYTEEELDFGQVGGEHKWSWLWLDWRSAYSRTTQDEPDTRYITYDGIPPQFTDDSLGGSRIFNSLTEKLTDSAVDFTIPFTTGLPFTDFWSGLPAKFKFGPAYSYRQRNFEQRRFVYDVNKAALDLTQPPETILQPSNLIPGLIDFNENTQPGDSYDVTQEIAGGYGMFDLPIIRDQLRFIAGVREEYSYINLQTFALGLSGLQQKIKNNLDPLPGANLIYSPRPDMNIRAGYSQSVSRPEFRELSPTQYPSPRGLRPLIGNPNLVESHITNWDLRWEWFFSPLEIASISYFHKDIDQPIEQTVIVESSLIADSFRNADNAVLNGVELEGRKDFAFVSPRLQPLSLWANFTYVDSTVNVPRAKTLEVQTSTQRPLQGLAPYIANGVIEWDDPKWGDYRLLYYTAGPRITSAGSFGLPDITEQRRDQLDFVAIIPIKPLDVPMSLKLTAENLLDDNVLLTQGGAIQREYKLGVKVTIGLGYTFN
jgi:hypothetical protein